MKKLLTLFIFWICSLAPSMAQSEGKPFQAHIVNKEYDVYMKINLYEEDIEVPGQELYGPLHGFLGKNHNSFCWVITSAKVEGNMATISLINDYGSEDLTASLTLKNDSTYILKQMEGSTLKVPKNGKWQKLPKTLEFMLKK
jgi:hypothetical protein